MLTDDEKHKQLVSKRVAFGTTLPFKLQIQKAGLDVVQPLQPVFPYDLRSKKALFKGITHLRYLNLFIFFKSITP